MQLNLLQPSQTWNQQHRIRYWAAVVLVAAVPILVTVALVSLRSSITSFVPTWEDEVSYWHQTLTYVQVGFDGGYYTVNELPPAASFTHFYTHGPWYPMLFGTIGRIIGWQWYTPVIINMFLVSAGLLIFLVTVRLDIRQLALAGGLMLTFWPVLIHLPSAMQESIHQFHAAVLATIFVIVLRKREQVPGHWQLVFALYVALAGITRLSWVVLFPPLFVLMAKPSLRGWLLALVKSIGAITLVFLIVQYTGAPGNNSIFSTLGKFSVSLSYGFEALVAYVAENVQRLFDLTKNPLDVLHTFQVLVFIIVFGAASVVVFRRGRSPASAEIYFHAYNLSAILVASLALYIIGTMSDYRIISTHLLLSLLVLIANRRYLAVAFIIVTNLLLVINFLTVYRNYAAPKFKADRDGLLVFQAAIQPYVAYDSATTNPWCNTLLHQAKDLLSDPPILLSVPAGIGASFFFVTEELSLPLKSQYLMLGDDVYTQLMQRAPEPRLVELTRLPNERTLYRNLDANCRTQDG